MVWGGSFQIERLKGREAREVPLKGGRTLGRCLLQREEQNGEDYDV
jgi:hypothetical protein